MGFFLRFWHDQLLLSLLKYNVASNCWSLHSKKLGWTGSINACAFINVTWSLTLYAIQFWILEFACDIYFIWGMQNHYEHLHCRYLYISINIANSLNSWVILYIVQCWMVPFAPLMGRSSKADEFCCEKEPLLIQSSLMALLLLSVLLG